MIETSEGDFTDDRESYISTCNSSVSEDETDNSALCDGQNSINKINLKACDHFVNESHVSNCSSNVERRKNYSKSTFGRYHKKLMKPLPIRIDERNKSQQTPTVSINQDMTFYDHPNEAKIATRREQPSLDRSQSPIFTNKTVVESTSLMCTSTRTLIGNSSAYHPRLAKRKRCRKDGYVAQFRRVVQKARIDRRHLVNDERLGFAKPSRLLHIVDLYESFGVKFAKVRPANNSDLVDKTLPNSFILIVDDNMAAQVNSGCKLINFYETDNNRLFMLREN